MKGVNSNLPGVLIFDTAIYEDERGFFVESFNQRSFEDAVGRKVEFVQDNHSRSVRHVLRGLHYQIEHSQGKLVRVISGEIFDVAVDLRRSSATFGQWAAATLSAGNRKQMWVPEGFGHGFLVLSETAEIVYKVTDYYSPKDERSLMWNDPEIGISWPLSQPPILSARDRNALPLRSADTFP